MILLLFLLIILNQNFKMQFYIEHTYAKIIG